MEEYYVSMIKTTWRDIGSICKRVGEDKYDYIGNKNGRFATTVSFNDRSNWIPATLQEAEAYKSGIGNIKDIIYSKIIEIW